MALYRAHFQATAGGQQVHNVLHVQTVSGATAQDTANDLRNAWQTRVLPYVTGAYQFQGVEITPVFTDGLPTFAGATSPASGSMTGPTGPTFVCISVRLLTNTRGRAGQGRFGLSPISEDATDNAAPNQLSAGYRTSIQNGLTAFLSDLASSGNTSAMELAVVSFYKGKDLQGRPLKRAEPLISPVVGVAVNSVLGTRLSRHPNR